jgi:hypothetical protein
MKDRVTLDIRFTNLRPEQADRIRAFLGCWHYLACVGASRKTQFYLDGDGSDDFRITEVKRGLFRSRTVAIPTSDPDALDRFVPTYNTVSLRMHLAKKQEADSE